MLTEEKSSIQPLPESVNTAIGNLSHPITHEIGNTLGELWYLVFGNIHQKAEEKKLRIAHSLNQYRKELVNSISCIPEEYRQEAKLQIAGPALEISKYCIEESKLREMFVNLISSSVDTRKSSQVHPSFAEIISQMSPVDAQNLSLFRTNYCAYIPLPICKYIGVAGVSSYTTLYTHIFLENKEQSQNYAQQSASISSLERLGLITISYDQQLNSDEKYSKFYDDPLYLSCKYGVVDGTIFDEYPEITGVSIQKGLAALTPLGEQFASICLG